MRAQIANHRTARSRTLSGFRFASAIAIIVAGFSVIAGNRVVAAETPKAQPTAPPTEVKAAPAKPEPISLDDYMAGVAKPGISDGDKAAFAKKHAGAQVTWSGYLQSISKNMSPDGAFYQLILKARLAAEEGKPLGLFVVQPKDTPEKVLLALEKDQKVTVSGTLTVGANPALPMVANATLPGS